MTRMALSVRRGLWLALFGVLLSAPHLEAQQPGLAVDFDGDGQHDRVVISAGQPSVLHVWLSATGTTEVIRSVEPLLNIAAVDLDGDRRPELIASGSSPALRIWTRGVKGFRAYRPKPAPAAAPRVSYPAHRLFDDWPSAPVAAAAPASPAASGPAIRTHGIPAPLSAWRHAKLPAAAPTSTSHFAHIGPRPPPAPAV